jgi:hypothetical protein
MKLSIKLLILALNLYSFTECVNHYEENFIDNSHQRKVPAPIDDHMIGGCYVAVTYLLPTEEKKLETSKVKSQATEEEKKEAK